MNEEIKELYRLALIHKHILAVTQSNNNEYIICSFAAEGRYKDIIKNVYNKCGSEIGEQAIESLKTGEYILRPTKERLMNKDLKDIYIKVLKHGHKVSVIRHEADSLYVAVDQYPINIPDSKYTKEFMDSVFKLMGQGGCIYKMEPK